MPDPDKNRYATKFFGLPVEQVKFFDELTPEQKKLVIWHFNFSRNDPDNANYVYAIKRDGNLVSKRYRRVPLMEIEYDQ